MADPNSGLSVAQFGATIKVKHPEYADIPDAELGARVLTKYPQYGDMIAKSSTPMRAVATGTISADKPSASSFFADAQNDLRYGGTHTVIGKVAKAIGIQPLGEKSNPITDTVLGPLQAAQGVAQLRQQPLSGVGNIVGGGLKAATIPLSFVAPEASEAIVSKVPSVAKEQAGKLFASVAEDANKIPINLQHSQDAIGRLMDWQKTTNLGPTINKFLNRITAPNKGPITYEEARKVQEILGDMSANEKMNLAAPIKRDVVNMLVGLKQDIAQSIGPSGGDYLRAMSQYRYGAQAQKLLNKAVGYGATALGAGAAGHYLTDALSKR